MVNERNHLGWEVTVEETELGPGQLLLEITLLAPAMAVLSAEDSSEAVGLGLQVRWPWVLCTVQVLRPPVLRCHYLTAKWDGVWEKNLTARCTSGSLL